MALKQASRLLSLQTPLGDNEMVLTGFTGEEGLSRLFRFQLEMISDNNAVSPKDVVGKNVTFGVRLADDSLRRFNGVVARFQAGDEDENGRRSYRAEVVPQFWFLTRNADCRIFENKTLKQIIEEVFSDRGLTDYKIDFKGKHAEREYCVQFRESDFNFLSRLMEEEGVWYAFKHEDGKHTMLIADKSSAYFDCQQKEVDYPFDFGGIALEDHIRSWNHNYEFRSGKVAQADYNFKTPSADLGTSSTTIVKDVSGADKYELFDYPGYYFVKSDGQPLADVRMEEEEVEHDVVEGTSLCRCFTPGGKFKIRQHRSASEKGKSYVVTSVQHQARELMSYETGGSADEQGYANSFTCIPDSVNFRPQRRTSKPSVQGLQTAVVIGDDEIPVDEYGRVRVRFFWDRKGKKEDVGTCWVRVSQLWASAEWGGMHIPHKDDEVLVDFIDGDPDRPMIVGRVYNAQRKVPLPLPDEKTKSIIRDYGNNQMIWEGKPGQQYLHIQQECGNELLMNGIEGKESVQLRDKFGNEIFMDSVGGTMRLSSPSHNSVILLGNSIYQQCDSNNSSFTAGDTINVHKGLKHDVYKGFRSQTDIGGYYEAQLGFKSCFVIGSEFAGRVGSAVGLQYAKQVNLNIKDYVQHSAGPMKIDSDGILGLVGGAGDSSKAILGPKAHIISYKSSSAKGRPSFTPGDIAALILGLAGPAGMIVNGAQMKAMKDAITAKIEKAKADGRKNNKPQDQVDKEVAEIAKTWTNSNVQNFNGELVAGIGAVAGALAAKLASNSSDVPMHAAAEGEIHLTKNGVAIGALNRSEAVTMTKQGIRVISQDADVEIKADKAIVLHTLSANITVTGKITQFGKTKIKQKNLLVD
ncbi:MAG: hypothetical protein DCC67_02920 [Planctomycetota bacterium]|nr:MAG: hypothetical protein DCC67_02920 [Planctomycetota bacterium]